MGYYRVKWQDDMIGTNTTPPGEFEMTVTREELDRFHRFASEKIGNGGSDLSWDELFIEWRSAGERDEINTAIRKGLEDVEAGRVQAADEAMETIRKEFGFTE